MRIIIADDDPVSCKLIEHVITTRTDHEVVIVNDGDQALDLALGEPRPDVLILDWVMPTLNGTEVCQRVRAASLAVQPYVLLITAKNKREEVIEGMTVGADDLVRKPIPPDVLVARLKLAEIRPKPGRPATRAMLQALVDAREEGNGELDVRSADTTARVFFHQGKVAWAHLSDDPIGLFDILDPESGIDQETASEVLKECRRTGARLSDTLVAFGLVDRAKLRECMQSWLARKIAGIRQLREPETLFLPAYRTYAEDLLFDLEELMEGSELVEVKPSEHPPPKAAPKKNATWETAFVSDIPISMADSALIDRCMAGRGVKGVAIMDRETGRCLGQRGARMNPDVVWAHIQLLNALQAQERPTSTAIVADRRYHLVRMLTERPNVFVYVVVNSEGVGLGEARHHVEQSVLDDAPIVETDA